MEINIVSFCSLERRLGPDKIYGADLAFLSSRSFNLKLGLIVACFLAQRKKRVLMLHEYCLY